MMLKEKIERAFYMIMDEYIDSSDRCGCCQTDDKFINIFSKKEWKELTNDFWNHIGDEDVMANSDNKEIESWLKDDHEEFVKQILNCLDIKVKERFQ